MLLVIDVGNTNTVFAVFDGDNLKYSWRCKSEATRSPDEYAVFLKQLFDLAKIKWGDINDVIISSVVPDANFHLENLCKKYMAIEPVFVDARSCDIEIDLDNPDEIGADRIVNAIAVIANYDLPAVVIDFGTATTFDVIDKDGVYRGGVISTGIRLSVDALTSHAAKLPQINIEKPDKVIGKNTMAAMQSGIYWGYIGVIETIIAKISDEMGDNKPLVIATGGLASLYANDSDVIDLVDDNLIFKGLFEIYKKSKE